MHALHTEFNQGLLKRWVTYAFLPFMHPHLETSLPGIKQKPS